MTFLLCLGSVAPTFAADKKKDLMPQLSMLLLSKQLPVRFIRKDATTPTGIGSITKLLTAYMVYKAVDQGELKWNTKVDIF